MDGTTLAAGGVAFREADAVLFSAACVWRVTADGARLVAVLQDDPENERIPATGSGEQPGGITAIALDAAGGRLLTGGVDARINKAYAFQRWKLTLYGEVINLLDRSNYLFMSFDGYNSATGRVSLSVTRMFPIIPSIGVVLEFEGRQ